MTVLTVFDSLASWHATWHASWLESFFANWSAYWPYAAAGAGLILVVLIMRAAFRRNPYPYEEKELLTKNELSFYRILYPITQKYGWMLLIKMRLADVLAVSQEAREYMPYFNKIKAKHTDFVFLNPETLEVLAALELDDKSHDRPDRMERDHFVDQAYRAAGIPLIHVRMPISSEELEDILCQYLPDFTP